MQGALDAIRPAVDAGGSLGTVVYLGAGRGADLPAILARSPQRLILVEGDADQATVLRRRFAGYGRIEVRCEVVSPRAGPQAWHRYNLQRLNGLMAADARLRQAYPRLKALDTSTVETVAVEQWLSGLEAVDAVVVRGSLVHDVIELARHDVAFLAARHRSRRLFKFGKRLGC